MTKKELKQLIKEVISEMIQSENTNSNIRFNGKSVDVKSIEIDNIDKGDYPDFSDAYISYAEYVDGTPLNDIELEKFGEENSGLASELVHDRQLYF